MASETVILAASAVCTGLVLVAVRSTRHLADQPPIAVTAEWLDQLYAETDELLCLQERRLLPKHLPRLKDDFKLICHAVKMVMIQSDRDRPDLARALVRSQLTFAYRLMNLQIQLARGRIFPDSRR